MAAAEALEVTAGAAALEATGTRVATAPAAALAALAEAASAAVALAAAALAGLTLALVKVAAAMGTRAAEALPPALAVALATAKRKRRTERENRRAQHRVAPMGKQGRWGGINSTTEGRETSSPNILSPCGAAALNERRSDRLTFKWLKLHLAAIHPSLGWRTIARVSQVPTQKLISLRPSNFVCACCPKVG